MILFWFESRICGCRLWAASGLPADLNPAAPTRRERVRLPRNRLLRGPRDRIRFSSDTILPEARAGERSASFFHFGLLYFGHVHSGLLLLKP